MSLPGFQRFDVHWFSQKASRDETEPTQPNDDSKDWRLYVIVASPRNADKITCCPVQNSEKGIGMTEVELLQRTYAFLDKDCKISCQEIYTLPKKFFRKYVGHLNATERIKIETALKLYLNLK